MLEWAKDIAISLIICAIIYKIFEKYGFKTALLIRIAYIFVTWILQGLFASFSWFVLLVIGIGLLEIFVITIIEYAVFKKTESFWSWIIVTALIEFAVSYMVANIVAPIIT